VPYTANKLNLFSPPNGSYVGTWDVPLLANWYAIDGALGGTTIITLSSSDVTLNEGVYPPDTNPTLVTDSAQNVFIALQGTLSANVSVNLPAGRGGFWIFYNGTTPTSNNYTVSVKSASPGSNSIVLPNGKNSFILSNGFTVGWADNGNIAANVPVAVPAGIISPFGGTLAPSGYLPCDGAAVSRTTYAALFAAIGITWGNGDGSLTFNVPDLQDMFLRGSGSSAVGVYEADDFKSHTHAATVNDPEHSHAINAQSGFSGGAGQVAQSAIFQGTINTLSAKTNITVTNASTGGTETRPKNKRVLYIIKT
jgi:microcystin-dependent protein